MHKYNSRFSSKFKGCSPLQLSFNLTGMKPARTQSPKTLPTSASSPFDSKATIERNMTSNC